MGFLVFFPVLFLSPAFAPKEEWERPAYALPSIAELGTVTLSMTLMALRSRTA